jgi:glucokinase
MSTSTNPMLVLAIDVGGTQIKMGLVERSGRLLDTIYARTPSDSPPEQIVRLLFDLSNQLMERNALPRPVIDGVGISLAGFITSDGIVTATAHLSRQWIGYDLKQRLLQEWQTSYYFALDTPAPTVGEYYYGAGRGIDDLVYVTVSTGIGAGIIANGRYFTGGLGWAGGVGHTIIDETSPRICEGCANHGCLETFAARQGIVSAAREAVVANPDSQILRLAGGDMDRITPRLVCEAAQAGDLVAGQVFRQAGHALGIGLTNLVDIVAPRRVIIGGGIAQAGEILLEPVRQVIQQRAFPPQLRQVEVVQAALGDLSGMFGAAALVFFDLNINPGD